MNNVTTKTKFTWEVGFCKEADTEPETFIPATVPGAVQLDYAAANGWPPFWTEKDPTVYDWMEDVFWLYRTDVTVPADAQSAMLVFKGIDYRYRIRWDGVMLYEDEGMFREHRLNVSGCAGQTCRLEVLLYPIPKVPIEWEERDQAKESCKPAVSYGWDFHPRLVPTGLWEDVYLEWGAPVSLISCDPLPLLSEDLTEGTVEVSMRLSGDTEVRLELAEDGGETVAAKTAHTINGSLVAALTLPAPRLWWPAGYGEQALYTLRVVLPDGGICLYEKELGFRRVSLEINDGEWAFPDTFPKSRTTAPITMTVNGRRLFAKGSNWVPPDVFFSRITDDLYERLLTLVRDANMNILRVWGGGIPNRDTFFELCDRYGIMVWQEFPLACNHYPNKPGYLKVLEKEASAIIRRLRSYPCHVLWCGGNELFNVWSQMDDQSYPLRLLNKLCFDLDRDTPFLMTSPLFGMGHGPYSSMEDAHTEYAARMPEMKNTAYTEFGVSGCQTWEYISRYCDPDELAQCRTLNDLMELRPMNGYPLRRKMDANSLLYHYGEVGELRQATERLSFLQGMHYKTMFEEMRKQWPRCSMAINWCFDAPWPLMCNENLVDWPCEPKPAYEQVRQALRSQLFSLRVRQHTYDAGEDFTAEVWLLNDAVSLLPGRTVEVIARYGGEEKLLLTWTTDDTAAQTNQRGPSVRWQVPPRQKDETFTIELRCPEQPEIGSLYRYVIRPSAEEIRKNTLNGL